MPDNTLALLARPNYRGVTTDRLVYMIQDYLDKLENFNPDKDIDVDRPSTHTQESWVEDHKYFLQETITGLEEEIQRRRNLKYSGVKSTNSEIIQTIKNAINIEDVLAWYTDVFLHKRVWRYRCTLHGKDNHPSGVIYPDEQRCWCFACNHGGDIFDVVQLFERLELPQAIAKLARYIGIDTKPITRTRQKAGGVSLEVRK